MDHEEVKSALRALRRSKYSTPAGTTPGSTAAGAPRSVSAETGDALPPQDDADDKTAFGFVRWAVPMLVFMATAVALAVVSIQRLPEPVPATAHPTVFSEERAMNHVKALADTIGVRVVGSHANEVLATNHILQQLHRLAPIADANGWNYELEVQGASGTVSYTFLYTWFSNVYTNVTNVVVRVSRKGLAQPAMDDALLLSAHYDSTLGTPGASDDAMGVGVLLECLSNVVHSQDDLPHPLIFILNGAEESFMQAAHGFITQHKWSPTVAAFINLESAGSGGPEILFQTGPHHEWLADVYARHVPHPHGSVMSQDIFQHNLIPGDTDYRIYRDFLYVHNRFRLAVLTPVCSLEGGEDGSKQGSPGFDMAFYKHGQLYHTKSDLPKNIEPGSAQHMGDNTLALLHAVVRAPEFPRTSRPAAAASTSIFFDVFGKSMIVADSATATTVQLSVLGVSILCVIVFWGRFQGNAIQMVGQAAIGALEVGSVGIGMVLAGVAGGAVAARISMYTTWYAHEWIGILLYGIAAVLGAVQASGVAHGCFLHMTAVARSQRVMVGMIIVDGVLLLLCMFLQLGSGFLFCFYLIAASAQLVVTRLCKPASWTQWVIGMFASSWLIFAFLAYMGSSFVSVLIGVIGRSGAIMPMVGELIVGGGMATICCLAFHSLLPLLQRMNTSARSKVSVTLLSAFAIVLLVARLLPSYDLLHPKRLMVQHVHTLEPVVLNSGTPFVAPHIMDSALLMSPMDSSPTEWHLDAFARAFEASPSQDLQWNPSLVRGHAQWQSLFPIHTFLAGVFMPVKPHPLYTDAALLPSVRLDADERFEAGTPSLRDASVTVRRRLTISVSTGIPGWSVLNITAPNLVAWSFSPVLPDLTCHRGGRVSAVNPPAQHDCSFLLRHAGGLGSETVQFWLELSTISDPIAIQFATIFVECHHSLSPALLALDQASPDWLTPTLTYGTVQRVDIQ